MSQKCADDLLQYEDKMIKDDDGTHHSIADVIAGAPVNLQQRGAAPTERGRVNSREAFEKLVYSLTYCKTGDGTLEVYALDRSKYINPHIQYLWERYQAK